MNFQPTVIPNPKDYLNTTAIFGGIKKTILSKDFKGGSVSNLCGKTELDFSHADLNGVAVLDISQAFGEITIIVPDDWRIEIDSTQLFAVVDDYRNNMYQVKNSDKELLIKGISFCAVVVIASSM